MSLLNADTLLDLYQEDWNIRTSQNKHRPARRASQVNIEIVRAFMRLRRLLTSNPALARKLAEPKSMMRSSR